MTTPEAALRTVLESAGWPLSDADRVRFSGSDDLYPCRFQAGVATGAALAAAGLARPGPARAIGLDVDGAALMSEGYRHVRLDGESVAAPRDALTGFYETRDAREIFLHVNFPHHRTRALDVLRAPADREAIAQSVKTWDCFALDEALAAAGAIAAPALSFATWDASAQGRAVSRLPLLDIVRTGAASPKPFVTMQHIRVLDHTRVLAGPTCGRFLAEAGADVTRIEHSLTPDLLAYRLDANRDKRELTLDLREAGDLARMHALAARADVVVHAYRPGAAARFGLDAAALQAMNPGLIHASLSAYGHEGPWSGRRGFDSVIQAACGLAAAHGSDKPKLLPTSPLDYAAGFLLAFGIEVALHRRAREGGGYIVSTSLARVAQWLRTLQHDVIPGDDVARREAAIDAQSTQTRATTGLIRHLRSAMTLG